MTQKRMVKETRRKPARRREAVAQKANRARAIGLLIGVALLILALLLKRLR